MNKKWRLALLLILTLSVVSIFAVWFLTSHNGMALSRARPLRNTTIRSRRQKTLHHRDLSANRIIYSWDPDRVNLYRRYRMNFHGCEYSNCVLNYSDDPEDAIHADVVLVAFNSHHNIAQISKLIRKKKVEQDTVWLVDGQESPRYHWLKWRDFFNDFDGAITYTKDAAVYNPYGATVALKRTNTNIKMNYAANKTKGAFAYVSNCLSAGYARLKLMKELGKYIDVDIYGGCAGNRPCPRGDSHCEARVHSQYHFYLSWENSLCTDYITEKFWKVLETEGYYIPVAVGGLTLDEYTSVSPPDSFLHLYNFSSVAQLGNYMNRLMKDPQAFNKYNAWRSNFKVIRPGQMRLCKLCEIANNPSKFKRKHSYIADKFNDPKTCKEIPQYQSVWSTLLNVLL